MFSVVAVTLIYSERVSVDLVIQHAMSITHIVVCGLHRSTIFFSHYLTNGTIFGNTFSNTSFVF